MSLTDLEPRGSPADGSFMPAATFHGSSGSLVFANVGASFYDLTAPLCQHG